MSSKPGVTFHSRQVGWGGGETFLRSLAQAAVNAGWRCTFHVPAESSLARYVGRDPQWWRARSTLHVFNDFGCTWRTLPAWVAARRRVFVCHGWWQVSRLRLLFCRFTRVEVVAISSSVADMICRLDVLGYSPQILQYGPAASDFPVLSEAERMRLRDHYNVPRKALVAGWIGRLQDIKRPALFMAAVRAAGEGFYGVAVVPPRTGVHGDEVLRSSVEKAALDSDRITVVEGGDPRALLGMFDVLVSTSEFESLGIAMMEGILSEIPVITTARGGPADFIALPSRQLPENAEADEIAEAMIEVAPQARTPQTGSQAKRFAEGRSPARALAQIVGQL